MKQEEKELLLKDLCARLPYGVKMNHIADSENSPETLISIAGTMITLGSPGGYASDDIENFKPYLFPLSSMTEEQYEQLRELGILSNCSHSIQYARKGFEVLNIKTFSLELIDFLNKNHFDYRGLIEKGLAIDATGLNIY